MDNKVVLLLLFSAVSEDDVLKVIRSSPQKSCQLEPWLTFMILECIDILLCPITQLVDLSLTEGTFPTNLKGAVITPLIKKPTLAKNELKNYWPISGLIFVSKLVERVVAAQLNAHLDMHGLVNVWQSAYKSGHSTESALLQVKNDIHKSLARGEVSALILLDLSAAFDTIDHNILLQRLSSWFGCRNTVLDWFRSYLSERTQTVKIGNALSDSELLDFGVPQGSVLGPLLFTLYTTPISKIISSYSDIRHHLYKDDTQVYISLDQDKFVSSLAQLQQCLLDINSWMSQNKLKLNPDKTEFLLVGTQHRRSKQSDSFPIDLLGNMSSPCDKVRNLGVIFDSDFSFSQHVSSVCRSCYYHIRDFCRIIRHLSRTVATQLANALISSRLDYCNSLLSSLSVKDLRRLQAIHNTIARIVMRIPRRSSASAALKSLHWLPVEFRIKFKIGVLINKALATGKPNYLASQLSPHSSLKNTRRSKPTLRFLKVPSPGPKIISPRQLAHSFQQFVPRLWNFFPLSVRTAPTLWVFRRRLKFHLFNLAFPP
jgi:hypothetical protein